MKFVDRILQDFRINQIKKYIPKGSTVLDIGSVDGVLFNHLKGLIKEGIGIDPILKSRISGENYTLFPGYFPQDLPQGYKVDVITMLAVLEHIPLRFQDSLSQGCSQFLKEGGKLIITVPSPNVDYILDFLKLFKLIDGMSLEEHYGFNVKDTNKIFCSPTFTLIKHTTFQFGLNNLFVFERSSFH